ncbi:MAG TPA: hypothetical protein IAA83_04435 [Candidatus Avoscillospira avistercoris]|uniref:YbbR-like protein n=1 Tax=Candidatus Avoscillospira avistercoris TaxID=2840707 RepID=A0A9D1F923_9FIRM|nr:hypothetical protein [Candidatus Avoscillospira avistercoris]
MKSKLVSMAVALLASLCLWIYVVTVVNQEVSNEPINDVAVTFYGADQIRADSNLVITEGADTTVNLRVTCSRSTLQKLSATNIVLTVDVSRIKEPGTYTMDYSVTYPSGVSNSDVKLNGTPQSVTFTVERFSSKTVSVRGILDGTVQKGYYAASMECSPNEVLLEGPESLISQVSYAQVILQQDNLSQTVLQSCPVTLIDDNGEAVDSSNISISANGVSVNAIEVRQPILQMKEIPIVVEFLDGGGVTKNDMIWSCDPQTITVAGEPEVLEKTNQLTITQVDLAQMIDPIAQDMPVTLPNGLVNVTELESVFVDISVNTSRIASKTMKVTDIITANEPEGYEVNVMTMQLTVTVRGPIDEVSQLTEDDVWAVIDASSLREGTQSVPVTIEVSGDGSVAAIGQYSAAVSLVKE